MLANVACRSAIMDIKLKSEDEEKKLEQLSGESNEPDVKEGVVATTTEYNGKDMFWRASRSLAVALFFSPGSRSS